MGASNKMGYENEPTEHRENLRVVFDDISARGITELVFGGDIGTAESNGWFFDLVRRYGFQFQLILGNHDSMAEVGRHYCSGGMVEGCRELIFAREDADLKSIFMDSSSNAISDDQFRWLRRELDVRKKVLLFVHHPVLAIDTPVDRSPAALKGRDRLDALLRQSSGDIVVFCGHYHMDDDVSCGNVRQFSTPAASYQIVKAAGDIEVDTSRFGYRLIEMNGAKIATRVVLFDKGRSAS
jgi:Icc protein